MQPMLWLVPVLLTASGTCTGCMAQDALSGWDNDLLHPRLKPVLLLADCGHQEVC